MVGDALRVVAGRHGDDAGARVLELVSDRSLLSAPRSLKEAVNCWFSNLIQTCAPVISLSVLE